MKKIIKNHPLIFSLIIINFLYLILLVASFIIKSNPSWADSFSLGFLKGYNYYISSIDQIIPFSLNEILIIIFALSLITLFILIIINLFKKRYHKLANYSLSFISIIFIAISSYEFFAAIPYNRSKLPISTYSKEVLSKEENIEVINYFIGDFNSLASSLNFDENGNLISPLTFKEMNKQAKEEYKRIETDYLYRRTMSTKTMLFPYVYSQLHITGFYLGLNCGAMVNYSIPKADLPFTMLHELAHSKGVMREDDAQLVSMYLCLTSSNDYFRFSGYYSTIYSIMSMLRIMDKDLYSSTYNSLNQNIKKSYTYSSSYWSKYTLLDDIGEFFNNIYLLFHTNKGTGSYVDSGGTSNPSSGEITSYSLYQKIYFGIYFDETKL